MEKIFFDLRDGESFVAHLMEDNFRKGGYVYPISYWKRGEEKGWQYQSQNDGSGLDTIEGARTMFEFTFC